MTYMFILKCALKLVLKNILLLCIFLPSFDFKNGIHMFAYKHMCDCLRAGRSGDRIPVGARFSAPVQTSSAEVKNRVELYLYSP